MSILETELPLLLGFALPAAVVRVLIEGMTRRARDDRVESLAGDGEVRLLNV